MGGVEAEPARSSCTEFLRGDQGSPSPQQSPRRSVTIPATAHNTAGGKRKNQRWCWGDRFCQPSASATTSSPERVSAAETSVVSEGCSACWQHSSPHRDGHRSLRRGRGRHRKNPQGDTRDGHCWLQPKSLPDHRQVLFRPAPAVPGQSTTVNPSPARSNRQGDQFNQFPTTATHTAVPGTWT